MPFGGAGGVCGGVLGGPGLGPDKGGGGGGGGPARAPGERRQDGARALAVSKIAKLLHEIALLLTPNDWNGLGVGRNALGPMTRRTNLSLGVHVVGGVSRRDGKADADSKDRGSEGSGHDGIALPVCRV